MLLIYNWFLFLQEEFEVPDGFTSVDLRLWFLSVQLMAHYEASSARM